MSPTKFLPRDSGGKPMYSYPWHYILACLAAWMHRQQQQQLEFARLEIAVLKEMQGGKRLRFTDDQRRRLAA